MPPRALVVTAVHVPLDARIYYRQITALKDRGWEVTYAAPWSGYGMTPRAGDVEAVDLPRAAGGRRGTALRAARRLLADRAGEADLVLLHDPELLVATAGLPGLPPVVWDVHEDVAASLTDRPWVPAALRPAARGAVRLAERWAEGRLHLTLAEAAYARRFRRPHPVVPNLPRIPAEVPPSGGGRVVYLGRVSARRGAGELIGLARRLAPEVTVEVFGPADADVRPALQRAADAGGLRWHGFVPNEAALRAVQGALAGLSLLHDEPNYRASLPTKLLEYLARGVPVVTTPLPQARRLVEASGGGVVVPFGDVTAAASAVRALRADPARRVALARAGRDHVRAHHDWEVEAVAFEARLRRWAGW